MDCLVFWRVSLDTTTEAKPLILSTPIESNGVPQQTFRALIGWLPDPLAVHMRSSLTEATPEQHLQAVLASKAQVAARSTFTPTNPITEIKESDLLTALQARPETGYIATEVLNAGGSWRFAMINLAEVLAFQPIVRVDHLTPGHGGRALSDEQLYELCFPAGRSITADEVTVAQNDSGYTITTLDPNIRVVPMHGVPGAPANVGFQVQYSTASSPLEMQLLAFSLFRVPNYLQVVHYQDRYMLRDGYTRAADLLSQGIQLAPCMLIETTNPALIGLRPGMLGLETVLSTRPPYLLDFWDDTITCLYRRPALRQVYHVSVDLLSVPR
jgi:hypothetical protein